MEISHAFQNNKKEGAPLSSSEKILITGINGTLAPVLALHLQQDLHQRYELIPWRRNQVPPEKHQLVEEFVLECRPHCICHLAHGDEAWAGQLAGLAARIGARFLFTSSALVFGSETNGPFKPDHPRLPTENNGQYKVRCEDNILAANPNAIITRLGIQIGFTRGGNNLVEALFQMMELEGVIEASQDWIPAVCFLDDTVKTLIQLIQSHASGCFHIDSNANCGMSMYDLAISLRHYLQRPEWQIVPSHEKPLDQRLLDPNIQIASITSKLALQ